MRLVFPSEQANGSRGDDGCGLVESGAVHLGGDGVGGEENGNTSRGVGGRRPLPFDADEEKKSGPQPVLSNLQGRCAC